MHTDSEWKERWLAEDMDAMSANRQMEWIESLLKREREDIRKTIEARIEKESYDIMICSKCGNYACERRSHNSEDGFSTCHGKKLERLKGESMADTNGNHLLNELLKDLGE